jgi:hypothetical protein
VGRSKRLASHLAQMWQKNSDKIPSAGMLRDEITYSILWQGDPFSCSKLFGKLACKLCKKERVALLRHSWSDGVNMLNDRSEIHGSCRHTARFHRLRIRSGTDDPSYGERVVFCFSQTLRPGSRVRIQLRIRLQGSSWMLGLKNDRRG